MKLSENWIAFLHGQMLAQGSPAFVRVALRRLAPSEQQQVKVFDSYTGDLLAWQSEPGSWHSFALSNGLSSKILEPTESNTVTLNSSVANHSAAPNIDPTATPCEVATSPAPVSAANDDRHHSPAKTNGRPKLGVVAREVTLMPAHWEWLKQRPGGASLALRQLVEQAMQVLKQENKLTNHTSVYKFVTAMQSDLPNSAIALDALQAGATQQFLAIAEQWQSDVRAQIMRLLDSQ